MGHDRPDSVDSATPDSPAAFWQREIDRHKFVAASAVSALAGTAFASRAFGAETVAAAPAALAASEAARTVLRTAMSGPARTLDPDGPDQNYTPSTTLMRATYAGLISYLVPIDVDEAKRAPANR